MSDFNIYQNSGYTNKRNRKRTLILDVDDSALADTHLGSASEFKVNLFEPLVIDKHSEIYLDNFLTFNSNVGNTIGDAAFCLTINEFNMKSNVASSSNNNTVFNTLIIPNDHKTVENNHGVIVHKGKKFNYVCDINPQKLYSLSGKITNLEGDSAFHGSSSTNNHTFAIVGIDTGSLDRLILDGETFTGINGVTSSLTHGTFLTTHEKGSTELHFATDADITSIQAGGSNINIVFTGVTLNGSSKSDITLTNSTGTNDNLHLIKNPARFIAEFSIISRE